MYLRAGRQEGAVEAAMREETLFDGVLTIHDLHGDVPHLSNVVSAADSKQKTADSRQQTADSRQQTADSRQQTADSRQQTADGR
jgi:hypothetical protein